MLTITVAGAELFDESKGEAGQFVYLDEVELDLEHSLVSLSKWESVFMKPFLVPGDKTNEEVIGYIRAMCLTPRVPDHVFDRLSQGNLDQINEYLSSDRSATTFSESRAQKGKARSEIITSELIYFWMASYNIPFEAETWHLNRLFALLKIANLKSSKQPKMSRREVAQQQRALNEQRIAQNGGRG